MKTRLVRYCESQFFAKRQPLFPVCAVTLVSGLIVACIYLYIYVFLSISVFMPHLLFAPHVYCRIYSTVAFHP